MRKKVTKKIRKTYKAKQKFLGLSWVSVILLIFGVSIIFGGFVIMPLSKNTSPNPQEYLKIPLSNCETGDNLQLCTFIILSLTPTPEPTPESTSTFKDKSSSSGDSKSDSTSSSSKDKDSSSKSDSGGSKTDSKSDSSSGGSKSSGSSGGSSGGSGGGAPPL